MDRNDYYGGDSASLNLTQVGAFLSYLPLWPEDVISRSNTCFYICQTWSSIQA